MNNKMSNSRSHLMHMTITMRTINTLLVISNVLVKFTKTVKHLLRYKDRYLIREMSNMRKNKVLSLISKYLK